MKLSKLTIERLAQMICGASGMSSQYEWEAFPYRSSSQLTRFFHDIDLDYAHDGSTRVYWVMEVLTELNGYNANDPRLPSDELVLVIEHLLDPLHFEEEGCNHAKAVADASGVLGRNDLRVSFIDNEVCIEHVPSGAKPKKARPETRPLNPAEKKKREQLLAFLVDASEDEFTEVVVVPLFQHLGYSRVKVKGHREKSSEFGKDLWMKLALPSEHILYFGAQVKIGRVHAAASEPTQNIANILSQLKMLFEHPVFDPVTNSKHLVDHAYLISSGEITEQARHLISEDLSRSMKRQILFMDQDDILRIWSLSSLDLPDRKQNEPFSSGDSGDIPF